MIHAENLMKKWAKVLIMTSLKPNVSEFVHNYFKTNGVPIKKGLLSFFGGFKARGLQTLCCNLYKSIYGKRRGLLTQEYFRTLKT